MQEKILLDTDIGSDIDDCLCLGYLLRNPQCNLLGITTVGGESVQRARVAHQICQLAGAEDIPIFPGAEYPLLGKQLQDRCQQAAYLTDTSTSFPTGQAVAFLHEQICRNPGEITLLAIGPMTNIALLFSMYPETKEMLRGLVTMGGRFLHDDVPALHTPLREWNILCDPAAASLVYEANIANHRSIGLDVTQNISKPASWVFENLTQPEMEPVLQYFETWLRERGEITFHDPIAGASIFCPNLLQYREEAVSVLMEPSPLRGITYSVGQSDRHAFAEKIRPEVFFTDFVSKMRK